MPDTKTEELKAAWRKALADREKTGEVQEVAVATSVQLSTERALELRDLERIAEAVERIAEKIDPPLDLPELR